MQISIKIDLDPANQVTCPRFFGKAALKSLPFAKECLNSCRCLQNHYLFLFGFFFYALAPIYNILAGRAVPVTCAWSSCHCKRRQAHTRACAKKEIRKNKRKKVNEETRKHIRKQETALSADAARCLLFVSHFAFSYPFFLNSDSPSSTRGCCLIIQPSLLHWKLRRLLFHKGHLSQNTISIGQLKQKVRRTQSRGLLALDAFVPFRFPTREFFQEVERERGKGESTYRCHFLSSHLLLFVSIPSSICNSATTLFSGQKHDALFAPAGWPDYEERSKDQSAEIKQNVRKRTHQSWGIQSSRAAHQSPSLARPGVPSCPQWPQTQSLHPPPAASSPDHLFLISTSHSCTWIELCLQTWEN